MGMKNWQINAIKTLLGLMIYGLGTVMGAQWAGGSDSSVAIYRLGNVGIGSSSSPAKALDVSGDIATRGGLYVQRSTGSLILKSLYFANSSDNSIGDELYLMQQGSQPLHLGTNGAKKMTILSTGEVGIGITNPAAKLHVYGGNVLIASASSTGEPFIQFRQDATDRNYIQYRNAGYTEYYGNAYFTAGSVSVGTTTFSSGTKLLVSGGRIKADSIEATNKMTIAGVNIQQGYGSGFLKIYGVLEVTSGLNLTGNLSCSGGISAPGNVSGDTIKCEVVKINNWKIEAPDYVFEKGYKVRNLEDVEKFVTEHKHLPDVPSAKEMTAKGVDLAEMNMTLLKKVEELTLYVIDQKKEIEAMKAEMKRMR